jgi:hypothetical protein
MFYTQLTAIHKKTTQIRSTENNSTEMTIQSQKGKKLKAKAQCHQSEQGHARRRSAALTS